MSLVEVNQAWSFLSVHNDNHELFLSQTLVDVNKNILGNIFT